MLTFCRLAEEGHHVVGVEGAETAAKDFMDEHHLHYDVQQKVVGADTVSVYVVSAE